MNVSVVYGYLAEENTDERLEQVIERIADKYESIYSVRYIESCFVPFVRVTADVSKFQRETITAVSTTVDVHVNPKES